MRRTVTTLKLVPARPQLDHQTVTGTEFPDLREDRAEEKATAGWKVEVTPLKAVNHAVTFRLRRVRALDNSNGLSPASEDVEVKLPKPDETTGAFANRLFSIRIRARQIR